MDYDYYCGEGADDYPSGDGRYAGINAFSLSGRRRTLEVRFGYEAAWSADGRRLAYTIPSSFNHDPGGGIWVARADGSQRRRL